MKTLAPAVVIPLVVVALFLFVPGLKERPWTAWRIAGAIVAVLGYILVVTSRIQLGKSFSIAPQAKELVTSGLYSRIRNPMYFFLDVMLIGLAVALHMYWLLIVVVVLLVMQTIRGRQEAAVLQQKFGPAYLDYRKHTWF
jgi:protein-S-isoprenylcysteine O-methyltransferase Ste14